MNTIILYNSMHGCAEQCANQLKDKLKGNTDVFHIKKDKIPDLSGYDTVVIGGSIHAGMIQGSIKKFAAQNSAFLQSKTLGLYICCMDEKKAEEQFNAAFPEDLRKHAKAKGLFGGAFDFTRMNFLHKAIIKKVAGVNESVDKINTEAVGKFAEELSV